MKIKHAILLFALGYCFDFIGAFERIMHTIYANPLLMIGMILKVLGLIVFLYKLLTYPKAKDFLNW